ncbi:helix-turn-helix domain-containing protein [Paraflavitalea pollutisoli]|uniref:helix-turn-helix domain-containing protein n=1 Tax=Paraflavitalea pollutisoli TaxID=3034143 RepID=UPI0023EAC9F4|nr:helix-turn-helix domain-containing protein [Paraflavitalea sp. H1-2-19X]
MESWQTGLLLIAAVQGLLLGVTMVLPGKQKHVSGIYLGIIILVLSLELLTAWSIGSGYHHSPQVIPFWLLESYLFLPAAAWLFMQSNLVADFRPRPQHLLLFVPGFVEVITESIAYVYNLSAAHPIALLRIRAWWLATEILPVICMAAVLVWSGRALLQRIRQDKALAAVAGLHPTRLLPIFGSLALLVVLWVADAVLLWPVFPAVALLIVVSLFSLSFFTYTQSSFLQAVSLVKSRPAVQPAFHARQDELEWERLQSLLAQDGLYKRSKLSLEELAKSLDLPSRYVSHLINTYHGANFHQYLNSWRVQEVIRKMADPAEQHKTLVALALESGFSSKSSFQQVFKLHTGQSPSQFVKREGE